MRPTARPDSVALESAQALPGFRRVASDENGAFQLHISQAALTNTGRPAMFVTVFARGLLKHQFTAVFLEDDHGLAQSTLLEQIPCERRNTLLARKNAEGEYHWDIRMQGAKETVFFDYI